MPIRLRRTLFYLFVLIFIATGAGLTLYSQGYRLDWKTFAVEKIGGIFVKSEPEKAEIFLDGKPIENKSWFLQSGTLISNLLPGKYTLVVKLNGFHPWTKNLEVKPSLVTEADKIILVKNAAPKIFFLNATDFWQKKNLLILKSSSSSEKIIYSYDNAKTKNITGETIISVNEDEKTFITKNVKNVFFLETLNPDPAQNLSNLIQNASRNPQIPKKITVKNLGFYPGDPGKFIIDSGAAIYLFDKIGAKLEIVDGAATTTKFFRADDKSTIWQNAAGELIFYNAATKSKRIAAPFPSEVRDVKSYGLENSDFWGVLEKSGRLTLVNLSDGKIKEIASRATVFMFISDNSKIVFADDDGKINVKYLTQTTNKNLSMRLSENSEVESFTAHKDSNHVLVKLKNGKVVFTELDEGEPLNSVTIDENVKTYYYEKNKNSLFYIKDANLLQFDF